MSLTVDVHAHLLLSTVEAAVATEPGLAAHKELDARRNGAESLAVSGRMVGQRLPQLTDPARRLADMDSAGVDVQVVSPSPSHYHYWAGRDLAPHGLPQLANRGCRGALSRRRPTASPGSDWCRCSIPTSRSTALDDAVKECGLRGVEISSHAAPVRRAVRSTVGAVLGAGRRSWARWSSCTRSAAPWTNGWTASTCPTPSGSRSRTRSPCRTSSSPACWTGIPTCGSWPRTAAGTCPTYLGRSDHAWLVRPEARGCAGAAEQLPAPDLVRLPGAHPARPAPRWSTPSARDRVLLGSDYPFDMGVADPVQRLAAAAGPYGHRRAEQRPPHPLAAPAAAPAALARPWPHPKEQPLMTDRLITHLRHVDLAVPDFDKQRRLLHRPVGPDRGRPADTGSSFLAAEGSPGAVHRPAAQGRREAARPDRLRRRRRRPTSTPSPQRLGGRRCAAGQRAGRRCRPPAAATASGSSTSTAAPSRSPPTSRSAQHRKIEEGESIPVRLSHVVHQLPRPRGHRRLLRASTSASRSRTR